MDILGKEGERAVTGLEQISGTLNDLQSHINAVENAVQDIGDKLQRLDNNRVTQEDLDQIIEFSSENNDELVELRTFFSQLSERQKTNNKNMEEIKETEREMISTLKNIQTALTKNHKRSNKLESRIKRLENKLTDLQRETQKNRKTINGLESEKQQIKDRIEKTEFEEYTEKKKDVEDELETLKQSIKQFADKSQD